MRLSVENINKVSPYWVIFENVDYYAGLLMRKDNPRCDAVIAAFHNIIGDLPEQMIWHKE